MNVSSQAPSRAPGLRTLGIAVRAGVVVWAVFWSWFAVLVAASEGVRSLPYAAGVVLVTGALALLVWMRPAIGGVLLVAFAVSAAWFFLWWGRAAAASALDSALWLFAMPPGVFGAASFFLARRRAA